MSKVALGSLEREIERLRSSLKAEIDRNTPMEALLRGSLGFVMKLAGFSATPAEEMSANG